MKNKAKKSKKQKQKIDLDQGWELINPNAAGIDIGSREHWACVPAGRTEKPVRPFGTFTADLEALADWFQECHVTSVAMEATGVRFAPRTNTASYASICAIGTSWWARAARNASTSKRRSSR